MADELIDIYDENNNSLEIWKMKHEAHQDGLWHRAAHIWVYNSQGEILLQLRAKNKKLYPAVWDCSSAGHVSLGEEPVVSGIREAKEEIGLSIKKEDLEFFKIFKREQVYQNMADKEFYYAYFYKYDGDIANLKLQKEEVEEVRFLPVLDFEEEIKKHPEKYLSPGSYWFEIVKEFKRRFNF